LQQARANLSETKFEEAQTEGRNLTLEQAQEFAIYLLDRSSAQAQRAKQPDSGLTRRELEVAALIGSGKSNIEIARELFLSKRTVESHVAHILAKLGFKNRPQIVRWAVENGLVDG
jgi:non-specific serine/threonine protein kinase